MNPPRDVVKKKLGFLDTHVVAEYARKKSEAARKAAETRRGQNHSGKPVGKCVSKPSSGINARKGRRFPAIPATPKLERGSKQNLMANLRLIICYDLGTTFSGISWAPSTAETVAHIHVVKDWIGSKPAGVYEKVRTAIAFPDSGVDGTSIPWGYAIPRGRPHTLWFKLIFATEGDLKEIVDDTLLKQAVATNLCQVPDGKSVEDVLEEMYRLLHQHARKNIHESNTTYDTDRLPTTYVITVPAEYREDKKIKMEAIVRRAGIGNKVGDKIVFLSEPEAAANLVLHEPFVRDRLGSRLSKGVSITAVDIGGGSFDVVSFNVEELDPPKVKQIHPPEGGYCGATSVSRMFLKWCYEVFGQAFHDVPETERGPGSAFIDEFEEQMKNFTGQESEGDLIHVSLPTLGKSLKGHGYKIPMDASNREMYDTVSGQIQVSMDAMKGFYEPMREKACGCVKRQIEQVHQETGKNVKILALCGGFALCKYVLSLFTDFCNNDLEGDVQLICPTLPWSCVATGGVLGTLLPYMSQNQMCRMNLAVEVHRAFDESRDSQSNLFNCELDGARGTGHLMFLFRKFEMLQKKRTFKTYFPLKQGESCVSFEIKLWSSNETIEEHEIVKTKDRRMRLFVKVNGIYEPKPDVMRRHLETVEGQEEKPLQVICLFDVTPVNEYGKFMIVARVGRTIIKELECDFVPGPYR